MVTRDELRRALWPEGITVDFDQSLNKCVTKLRDALGDRRPVRASSKRCPSAATGSSPTCDRVKRRHDEAAADARSDRGRRWSLPPLTTRTQSVTRTSIASAGHGRRPRLDDPGARRCRASGQPRRDARGSRAKIASAAATRSPIFAARDAYERGRAALSRRSEESLQRGLEHFSRAIALSPRYAEAYVGLADSWSLLASYGMVDPREAMPRARDAANRALMLDAGLARAHAALGRTTMIYDWDWRTAGWHFTRALALEPGDATTHQWYAYYLSATGRHDEAIDEARRAVAAEPLSLSANTALGFVLYLARRTDEAAAQLERTLAIDPDFAQARRDLGLVRVQQGRYADAVAELRRVATLNERSPAAQAELGWAQADCRRSSGRAGES